MKDRLLCAFMLADIRSADSSLMFKAGNCRAFRYSRDALEILVPWFFPEHLSSLSVTLDLSGLLAINVHAVVKRRERFGDYLLLDLHLNPERDGINEFALRRIYDAIKRRKTTNVDLHSFLTTLDLESLEFPYRDGFAFTHHHFELEIEKSVLHCRAKTLLGMADYHTYLAMTYIAAKKIVGEYGFFDRSLDVSAISSSSMGPMDILLSHEVYIWACSSGLRHSTICSNGVRKEFNATEAFSLLTGDKETPSAGSPTWKQSLDGILVEQRQLASGQGES